MSQNITWLGASYTNVPAVTLPKTGGGTARFTDTSDTTATAADVAQGSYFYTAAGVRTAGTASGGGGNAYTRTVICPQQTVTPNSSRVASYAMSSSFVDGEYYVVTYDGTEYIVTSETIWTDNAILGDAQVVWQTTDTLYPFALISTGTDHEGYFTTTRAHTIKVEHLELIAGPISLVPKTITTNGTYSASSDSADGYSSVTVNVPTGGGTPNLQSKTATPTTSQQTITPDSGYDGLSQVTVSAMPTGTAGTPTATKGTVSNHSVSVTPSVTNTTGYITGGTKTGTAVTVSASELVSGSETKTANGTYDVTNLAQLVVNVSGGSSMNVQVAQSTTRVASTTYTKTATLTCSKAGTYDVYWDCFRSSTSGTNGSQLYVGGSEYGNPNTTFSSNIHVQSNHLTGVTLAANQEVAVYVRSRATNYYAYCGQLTIIQTA